SHWAMKSGKSRSTSRIAACIKGSSTALPALRIGTCRSAGIDAKRTSIHLATSLAGKGPAPCLIPVCSFNHLGSRVCYIVTRGSQLVLEFPRVGSDTQIGPTARNDLKGRCSRRLSADSNFALHEGRRGLLA